MFIPPEAMIKMLLGENKKRFCPNCGVRMHIDLYNHVLFCPKCYYEEILWKGVGGAHGAKIRTGMTTWHNQNQIIVEIVGVNWGERMKYKEILWISKRILILGYIYENHEKKPIHITNIGKKMNICHSWVNRTIKLFEKNNLVTKTKKGRCVFIDISNNEQALKIAKICYELYMLNNNN